MRNSKRKLGDVARRAVAGAGLLGITLVVSHAPARAADQPIEGVIDQAKLVKIPAGTTTLVIGNPTIADVTLLNSNNTMVLTPKSMGETNFIALDAQGNPLAQSTIRVVNGDNALVVQRGMDRQSYSCAPRCQPTIRLGDADNYLANVTSQAKSYEDRLDGAKAPMQPGAIGSR